VQGSSHAAFLLLQLGLVKGVAVNGGEGGALVDVEWIAAHGGDQEFD